MVVERVAIARLLMGVVLGLLACVPRTALAAPASTLDLGRRQQYSVGVVASQLLVAGGIDFVTTSERPGGSLVDTDEVDIYDGETGEWSTAQLSVARGGIAAATVGSQVLFAGGFDHDPDTGRDRESAVVDIYDSSTGDWSTASLSEPRDKITVAVVGTQVLFAGGSHYFPIGLSPMVDIYDSSDGSWSQATLSQVAGTYVQTEPPFATALPSELAALTAWTVGTQVLFLERRYERPTTADVYDSTTANWVTHDVSLDTVTHVVVSGQQVVMVGTASGAATAVVYDASTGEWHSFNINSIHVGGNAISTDSRVVLAGGSSAPGCTSTDAVDIYDVGLGRWSTARLSEGRTDGMAEVQVAGRVMFAGGLTCSGVSDHVDLYDPANDTWSTATLSEARAWITGVSTGSVAVLAGGVRPHEPNPWGEASDALDVYDAATGRWTNGHLSEPRVAMAPAVLGGQLLLAGGERPPRFDRQPYAASSTIDVYDAAPRRWSTDQLSTPRAAARVAQIASRIAFIGGRIDCVGCGTQPPAVFDIFGDAPGRATRCT